MTTTLHYLLSLYVCGFGQSSFPSLVVNHSIIDIHFCILTGVLPHSADLQFGLATLVYENAKN